MISLRPLNVTDIETSEHVDLQNLYPALVECFGIILLGYFAGRFGFVSNHEAKGIGTFVSHFALPALIFGSLCRLDLSSVRWSFLLAIFIAKTLLFVIVLFVTLFINKPIDPGKAGLFAIFVTQSNDFALGYPILKAIYKENHPEYPMYLYLLAPISLLILNPIGFALMELGKNQESQGSLTHTSKKKRIFKVFRNVLKNPVIFMTVAGVIGNFVFGQSLPSIVNQFLNTLGASFSACALFLLGMRMVGKQTSENLRGSGFVMALILILLKTVAMPIISREVMSSFKSEDSQTNDTSSLPNLAFVYGTVPTAPSVFVFANQYNILPDFTASAMVACTFVAAPIMFISARLLSIPDIEPKDYIDDLDNFLLDISIVSLLATVWVIFLLIVTQKHKRMPHFVTITLIVSQAIACIGCIMWSLFSCTHGWKLYLQFLFFGFGVFATRINTALLAITVLASFMWRQSELAMWRRTFIFIGQLIPLVLVLTLMLAVGAETPAHGQKMNPNFQYGRTQAYVALFVLSISFILTVISLVITQRYRHHLLLEIDQRTEAPDDGIRTRLLDSTSDTDQLEENNTGRLSTNDTSNTVSDSPETGTLVEIEDVMTQVESFEDAQNDVRNRNNRRPRYRCDSEHRAYCDRLIHSYTAPTATEAIPEEVGKVHDEDQLYRHSIFLLLLCISMFIGIAMCVWTLVMDDMSGLFLELVFLDGFLNFGQGLFSFAIFGLDANYVTVPVKRWFRRTFHGVETLVLPDYEDLQEETKQVCQQFLKYHIDGCMRSILKDIVCRQTTYKAVFRGTELVDWLLEIGLVQDRSEGAQYGRHLIAGRVIRHIDNTLDFYDDVFIYTFKPEHRSR